MPLLLAAAYVIIHINMAIYRVLRHDSIHDRFDLISGISSFWKRDGLRGLT